MASVVLIASTSWALAAAPTEASSEQAPEIEDATIEAGAVATVEGDHAPVADRPLQADADRHQETAVIGIAVLFVLGGVLVARNRLRDRPGIEQTDAAPQSEEFVTDRERVRRLVEDHGGRMKQAEIVDSVEWSKAKVSRLLADLESDGEITKLRLGRENLICLDGYEPPASRPAENPGRE